MDHRAWKWLGAAAALIAVGSVLTLTQTDYGHRAIRLVQHRTGWGEEGRRHQTDVLWEQAFGQFELAIYGRPVRIGQEEYASRADLLARREETIARAKAGLPLPPFDYNRQAFYLDLLLALDPAAARPFIRQGMLEGTMIWPDTWRPVVQQVFTDDELKALALEHRGYMRAVVLQLLREPPDQAYLEQFLLAGPAEYFPLEFLALPGAWEAIDKVYERLDTATRMQVVQSLHYQRFRQKSTPETWAPWLAREQDPGVRQQIYYFLNDVPAYLASLEEHGSGARTTVPWEWERRAAHAYPDSYFARGIAAYEAVRGQSYWHIDRRNPREWGDQYYTCDREVPGWLDFLGQYGNHQAADDAAYRLGRCYEISGHYAEALRQLHAATFTGDGSMTTDARSRIVWILDVMMDKAAIEALPADVIGLLSPQIHYTRAVKLLRSGQYQEARLALETVLRQWDGKNLPTVVWWGGRSDPWPVIRRQRAQAALLADLAAAGTPQARYDLAAAIYHDERLFYNALWGGGRQFYILAGYAAMQQERKPEVARWVAEQNHLAQAVAAFEQLPATAPAPLLEKAAYSRAMALLQLRDYGSDVALWQSDEELKRQGVEALEAFLERFPRSKLAPDALLSLAFVQEDRTLFERLIKTYPRSEAAGTARKQVAPPQ